MKKPFPANQSPLQSRRIHAALDGRARSHLTRSQCRRVLVGEVSCQSTEFIRNSWRKTVTNGCGPMLTMTRMKINIARTELRRVLVGEVSPHFLTPRMYQSTYTYCQIRWPHIKLLEIKDQTDFSLFPDILWSSNSSSPSLSSSSHWPRFGTLSSSRASDWSWTSTCRFVSFLYSSIFVALWCGPAHDRCRRGENGEGFVKIHELWSDRGFLHASMTIVCLVLSG